MISSASPGLVERSVAQRFFAALGARDTATLEGLFVEAPQFENIDGPTGPVGRSQLAFRLTDRDRDVRYELTEVAAEPGEARAAFRLRVAGVPGVIFLEAVLRFAQDRIASIQVRPAGHALN